MARKMKDSGIEWIGEIPEYWTISRYKAICKIESGYPFDSSLFSNFEGFPIIRIRDITSGIIETYYQGEFSENYVVTKGDLLVGMDGDFNIRWWDNVDALLNQRCCRIIDKPGLHRRFLYYTLPFLLDIIHKLTYSTTVKHLSTNDILNSYLVYPSEDAQNSIVNYLDHKCSLIDSIIEKQKVVIEKLRLYKRSIITEAVTKGLDPNVKMKPSGIEWIGHVPENWVICRIKDVAELNPKFSDSFSFNNNDEVSFCPMECIGQGYMTPTISTIDRVKNGYTFFADGDIVMAKVTPCFENGNIAIADGLTNGIGFGSTELYVFRSKRVNRLFLFYFLQNTIFRERCISSMYGVGGLKRVPLEFINTYHLALPPIKEQRIIAEFLKYRCSQIDATVSIKQNLIDKLTDYKKSLIYECVTGKREVV